MNQVPKIAKVNHASKQIGLPQAYKTVQVWRLLTMRAVYDPIRRLFASVCCGWVLIFGQLASAQQPGTLRPGERLRVFLDCQNVHCDFDFVRTEITFVDWVRNRQDAGIHLLVTAQTTGGGGREFTLSFIGQGGLAGSDQTLRTLSPQTASSDERRRTLVRAFTLGLARYAVGTPAADRITVTYAAPATDSSASSAPIRDPWNYWLYSLSVNGNVNGESRSKFSQFYGNISANRTTEEFKVRLSTNGSYGENKFVLTDGTFTSYSHSYGVSGLVVKSLGPHWSAGPSVSASSSTFFNYKLALRSGLAAEYNLFPYNESTRRQLTFLYTLGGAHFRYEDTTIFDRLQETRPTQSLAVSLDVKQRWGSASISLDGDQYLHDLSKYNLGASADGDLRIFKGFSLNFFGQASLLRDQLYLRKGGASDEEVLIRRRQLATSYRYFGFFGIRYSFGSIYNNVVNPRFGAFDF